VAYKIPRTPQCEYINHVIVTWLRNNECGVPCSLVQIAIFELPLCSVFPLPCFVLPLEHCPPLHENSVRETRGEDTKLDLLGEEAGNEAKMEHEVEDEDGMT
jgi:hypothetical protein